MLHCSVHNTIAIPYGEILGLLKALADADVLFNVDVYADARAVARLLRGTPQMTEAKRLLTMKTMKETGHVA